MTVVVCIQTLAGVATEQIFASRLRIGPRRDLLEHKVGMRHSAKFQYYERFAGNERHGVSDVGHHLDPDGVEAFLLHRYVLHGVERHVFHIVVQTSDVGLPVDDAQQWRFRVSHQNVLQQVAVDVHVDFGAQMNRVFCFDHTAETVCVLCPLRIRA